MIRRRSRLEAKETNLISTPESALQSMVKEAFVEKDETHKKDDMEVAKAVAHRKLKSTSSSVTYHFRFIDIGGTLPTPITTRLHHRRAGNCFLPCRYGVLIF